nr:Calx-beta domain-containing protein [Nitrosomonas nitrosa]
MSSTNSAKRRVDPQLRSSITLPHRASISNRLLTIGLWVFIIIVTLPLTGCGNISNTIAGLSTLQSTISGSNYVFLVDPDTGRLVSDLSALKTGENIRAGENFSISLDAGFLRYLQAVDPYVIVFSETWMGKKPRPADAEKTLRRIVLIKEGMTPNARLAVTSFPLLGPITMGEDLLDVYVTVKVVVLSKHDNQQTIQLVEGLASTAATAAPQYAPIAGAAASAIAAFISQNRDKVEFEHTFVFSPDGFAENSISSTPHASQATLREGKLVVVKGESRFRSIPYPNWHYYLWPFNWFGLSPDGASRRFEVDDTPSYTLVGEIIRLGPAAVGSLFSDAASDASFPWKWFIRSLPPTDPSRLAVDGYHLVKCVPQSDMLVPPHIADQEAADMETKKKDFWKSLRERHSVKESEELCAFVPTYRKAGEDNFFSKWLYKIVTVGHSPIVPSTTLYSEKTHMIVGIRKSKGTLGTFDELRELFTEHAILINEVTTTSSEANKISNARVEAAFESARQAIIFERTKREIRDEAKHGVVDPLTDIPDINTISNNRDKTTLKKFAIQENVHQAKATILNYAKSIKQNKTKGDFFVAIVEFIEQVKVQWEPKFPGENNEWINAWKQVVDNVHGVLMQDADFRTAYLSQTSGWQALKVGSCVGSREKPAISIADVSSARGPSGQKLIRLSTRVSPQVNEPFTLNYLTVDGTAKADTDFNQITHAPIAFHKGDKHQMLDLTIKSDGVRGGGEKSFLATVTLQASDIEKAAVCDGQSVITLRDETGPVAILTVDPILRQEKIDGVAKYVLTFGTNEGVADPIRFKFKVYPGATDNPDDFTNLPETELIIDPFTRSIESKMDANRATILFIDSSITSNARVEQSIAQAEYKDPT